MRLNRLGAGIIAVFVGGGLALLAAAVLLLDSLAFAAVIFGIIGVAWLAGGLIAAALVARSALRNRHNRWLARNGIRGRATIVEAVSEMSLNEQPIFKLVFDAEVPGQLRRRLERTIIVGSFAARRMEPGVVMPLYVNPRKPEDLLLVW